LEFKRSTDRDEGLLEVKKAEANGQHKSIIGALKAASPEWEFERINFVVDNRGSMLASDFYTKLKKLDVQEAKKDKLFADHVTQVCEAHNWETSENYTCMHMTLNIKRHINFLIRHIIY